MKATSLFHEGALAESIYLSVPAPSQVFCMGEDGYEQVLGSDVRGELLGFDAIGIDSYTNQAVALEGWMLLCRAAATFLFDHAA